MSMTALPYAAKLRADSQDHPQPTVLVRALADDFSVEETAESRHSVVHLDTADWRLRRAGIDLIWSPRSEELVASATKGALLVERITAFQTPALIGAIPTGPMRELIAPVISIRALLPFATTRTDRREFAVRNEDAKTVARLRWYDLAVEEPLRQRLPAQLEVERLRGYDAEAVAIERRLIADGTFEARPGSWLDHLWSLPAVGPADNRRFGMQPDQAADLAVADAMLGYLGIMESTVEGITADSDTEFLHDFRVAVRRTRSVLKLLGDVLPDGMADRAGPQFRWLGDITTPTRDLDVYLLDFDALAATVSRPADLAPFGAHLRQRRRTAQRSLRTALRTARFRTLCADWRAELAGVVSAPTQQGLTAADLADQRLRRTFRKVTKRSTLIKTDSPAEEIHALRKACKEMRYLLDVFKPLCEPAAYRKVISDFKSIQDVLGEFQDGEVQAEALHRFAGEMMTAGSADPDAILAMGELSGRFEKRQRVARETITTHHDSYLGKAAAAHVERLIQPRGRR